MCIRDSCACVICFNGFAKVDSVVMPSCVHCIFEAGFCLAYVEFITEYDFSDSVSNVTLALRFFLRICVSVASCERSFSKLKLIKSYLRSTMSQVRLTNLAMLSIEHEVAKSIDFDSVISKFASYKARKSRF